jgi:hypothetical protein
MEKIDIQNFKKYYQNNDGNGTVARVGHVNAVIDNVNTKITAPDSPTVGDMVTWNGTEWVATPAGGSDYTETIVNITPTETTYSDGRPLVASGILDMGTTPIELLPAAGVNAYYDIDKVVLEYTHITTPYSLSSDLINVRHLSNYSFGSAFSPNLIVNTSDRVAIGKMDAFSDDVNNGFSMCGVQLLNESIVLDTYNNTNPTLGNGTLRVKIYHKTITFGA